MSSIAISIENLSKVYRLGEIGTGTLSNDIYRWWSIYRGKEDPSQKVDYLRHGEIKNSGTIWALRNINLQVRQGEILGIIGKNGAGKSTLLKIISRITAPTNGYIKANGCIASLLEVGTGMHPEMTGKENVYLNGAILGMKKDDITKKFDDIVDFAGCARYINTPIKRYSSGMRVRLGFAVAAFLEPDIFIIDEILAVGDAEFQRKCINKMDDVSKSGKTVLFVSHNMSSIRNLCDRCIVLNNGEKIYEGDTEDAIDHYLGAAYSNTLSDEILPIHFDISERKSAQLLYVNLTGKDEVTRQVFNYRENIFLKLKYNIVKPRYDFFAHFLVVDSIGNNIFMSTDEDLGESLLKKSGTYNYSIKLPSELLKPGKYYLSIGINSKEMGRIDKYDNLIEFEIIDTSSYRSMKGLYRKNVLVAPELTWERL